MRAGVGGSYSRGHECESTAGGIFCSGVGLNNRCSGNSVSCHYSEGMTFHDVALPLYFLFWSMWCWEQRKPVLQLAKKTLPLIWVTLPTTITPLRLSLNKSATESGTDSFGHNKKSGLQKRDRFKLKNKTKTMFVSLFFFLLFFFLQKSSKLRGHTAKKIWIKMHSLKFLNHQHSIKLLLMLKVS